MAATVESTCANWRPDQVDCQKTAKFTCKSCGLVAYCAQACQRAHWPQHKKDCQSYLLKKTWEPAWSRERRMPAFMGKDQSFTTFGGTKYFWGNVPAIDIVKLEANEGASYDKPLRLLFAASGDLRHVIKTVVDLPGSYRQPLEVTLNDKDFDIVARNIILLLLAFAVDDAEQAVECMIHIWYSAFVRDKDLELLKSCIRPLNEDVVKKTDGKAPGSLQAKTWKFGRRSLRVVLEKETWDCLLSYLEVPAGLTIDRARKIRSAVTLAEERQDYRDRFLDTLRPTERLTFYRFLEDGLLLPFGAPRHDFCRPNPTFFQTPDTWPMRDNARPIDGWSPEEVRKMPVDVVNADMNGKLYFYLRHTFLSFLSRLENMDVNLTLYKANAASLPGLLTPSSFDRIDVSNIVDIHWLGLFITLRCMSGLLQAPQVNPHATLISLFMNAVDQASQVAQARGPAIAKHAAAQEKLMRFYLPFRGIPTFKYDPYIIKTTGAHDLVTRFDDVFNDYMEGCEFSKVGKVTGMAMKSKHTIIEPWPFRLKLRAGEPGALEEFERRMSGGPSTKERYVEWQRAA